MYVYVLTSATSTHQLAHANLLFIQSARCGNMNILTIITIRLFIRDCTNDIGIVPATKEIKLGFEEKKSERLNNSHVAKTMVKRSFDEVNT